MLSHRSVSPDICTCAQVNRHRNTRKDHPWRTRDARKEHSAHARTSHHHDHSQSLFFAILAARCEMVEINHIAQEFTRGVLSFAKVMVAEGKMPELLLERDQAALQETLNMIA